VSIAANESNRKLMSCFETPPKKKNNTRSANEEISPLNCMLSFSSDDQKCRFRDDVLPDFQPPAGSGAFLNSFTSDPRRGGYRGRYASGV